MNSEINEEISKKVLEVVDAGLSCGKGEPEPGKMCVEAAVCYALGLPHSDNPPCVGNAVRSFKIGLNDSRWSSNQARAKGMRRIALAQLGSDILDQNEFYRRLAEETMKQSDASAAGTNRDEVLTKMAEIGTQILIDMQSPGAAYLYLCE